MAGRRRWSACGELASAEGKSWKGELRRRRRRLKIVAGGGGGHTLAWWEMTNAFPQERPQGPRVWDGQERGGKQTRGRRTWGGGTRCHPSGSTCGAAITEQAAPPKTAVRRTGGSWKGVRDVASAGQAVGDTDGEHEADPRGPASGRTRPCRGASVATSLAVLLRRMRAGSLGLTPDCSQEKGQ